MKNANTDTPAPGQRWSSDAEPDLGLGTILSFDGRVLQIHFPACDELRSYALQSMPLSRVRFDAGERIEDHKGRVLIIQGLDDHNGLIEYRCQDLQDRAVQLPESQLNDQLRFNRPKDKLLGARLDKDIWYQLRQQSWQQAAADARSPVLGLRGARVGLIPHQLYIAHEVASRANPRVLLADEVGLGKTIEAGLILHRLIQTERVQRVLIVVPDALLHQWLVEMLRRFNLRFALFDQDRFDDADADNPFDSEQRILVSQDWLCATPKAAKAALSTDWDLLIVDEAHHLHWTPDQSSLEYDLIQALAEQIKAVLLLTATPEQLGRAGHFGRLRLLDPQRYNDYPAFTEQAEQFTAIAQIAGKLLKDQALDTDDQAQLQALLGDEAEDEPKRVLEKLVDRHGTGRVLFRNTRAAISGFPERQLQPHPLSVESSSPEINSLQAWLAPAETHGKNWVAQDPRVDWLIELIRQIRPEKALLICSQAQTAVDLRAALAERIGLHAAVFHEHMAIIERDRAAAYFADPDDGTDLLICSEIGSEGRNFQFAHHLILFDLPLEAELLEQRIGRLDRIGQTQTVQLHVPYIQAQDKGHSASDSLLRWYHDALAAFEAPSPAASAVQEQHLDALLECIEQQQDPSSILQQAATDRAKLRDQLEQGRDHLLELHSHRAEQSAQLIEQIEITEHHRAVADYMVRYWDAYGVEQEAGPGRSIILHPGSHMLHEHFPELGGEGCTVTFERDDALAHEDRLFLTWEHPMVTGCINMLCRSELGSASVVRVEHEKLPPGTLLLELNYLAECTAPPALEVKRYLPNTPIRLLLDMKGNNHAKAIPPEQLRGHCMARDRRTAKTVISSQEKRLRKLIDAADLGAQNYTQKLIQKALEQAQQEIADELHRLQALAAVSDAVNPDELDFLELKRTLVAQYLGNTRARLDALRLIIAT